MAAPAPMQWMQFPGGLIKDPANLSQGGSGNTTADALKSLGKNLTSANTALQNMYPSTPNAVAPGAPVTGAGGPTAAGGPQGPAPLPGQAALPGSPYSPAAGPPAPPPQPMVPNQPIGGAMVGGQPGAGQPPSPVGAMAQQPGMLQALIQRIMQGGGAPGIPGLPGSAATQGAGMLAPTMNNPSALGGSTGGL